VKCSRCGSSYIRYTPSGRTAEWLSFRSQEVVVINSADSFGYNVDTKGDVIEVHFPCATVEDLLEAWRSSRVYGDSGISYQRVCRELDKKLPAGWRRAARLRQLAIMIDALAKRLSVDLKKSTEEERVEFDRQTNENI